MRVAAVCMLIVLAVISFAESDTPKVVADVGPGRRDTKVIRVEGGSNRPAGLSSEGEEIADVRVDVGDDGEMHMQFTSHGRKHSLNLVESRIRLSEVPIQFLGGGANHDTAINNVKKMRMMVDTNYGASMAIDDQMQPVLMSGVFKVGNHEFSMAPHSEGKAKVTKRFIETPEFGNDGVYPNINRDARSTASVIGPIDANIETVMLVDYSLYQKFHADGPRGMGASDADEDLLLYFAHLASVLDTTYGAMQNDELSIRVTLAGIVVLDSPSVLPDLIEDHKFDQGGATLIEGEDALDRLGVFRRDNPGTFPPNDHVMMYSNYDLAIGTSGGLLGIAYVGAVCYDQYAVSFTEVSSIHTYVASVAAHELGHNLGSWHDSDPGSPPNLPGYSAECADENYIMAAFVGSSQNLQNRFLFTCCSQRSFYFTLIQGAASCVFSDDAVPNHPPEIDDSVDNYLPGEVYDADDQCYMTFGTEACSDMTSICLELYCTHPDNADSCLTERSAALDGTACDDMGNICYQGECVDPGSIQFPPDQNCYVGDCYGSEMQCATGVNVNGLYGHCYPASNHCDNVQHCVDNSDESNCDACEDAPGNFKKCRKLKRQCKNAKKSKSKKKKRLCKRRCKNNLDSCCASCSNFV